MVPDVSPTSVQSLMESSDLVIGDGYRAKNEELTNEGLPFARAQNIDNGFNFEGADCFPEANLGRVGNKVSQPGDVVFTSKGTVGRFALVREDTPRFVYSPQLCFWRSLNHARIAPRWLFYWMQSQEFYSQYKGVSSQTDMAEYVSLRDQRRMFISVPGLEKQRAIAHILGTLDDKIELNRRMNETLETIAQAIFKSWFVDFDPVHAKASGEALDSICRRLGLTRDLLALFPDDFQESEIREVPKGWEVEPFSKLARLSTESVKPYEQPEKVWEHYSIPAFDQGQQPVFEKGQDIKSNKYLVAPTAILSSKLNPHFPRTWLPCVAHPNVAICSTEFMPFVPHDRVDRTFVYEFVCSSSFQVALSERVTGTTGSRQRAVPSSVMSASFTIPPVMLRHSFSHLVAPLHGKQTQTIAESGKLAELRDTLLPKLLSGELRVKEAEKVVEAVA